MRKVVFVFFSILFFSLVSSQTYYVSNSGSDSNSGLTVSSPWKTLAFVGSKLSSGDKIFLKRGDIWREQFNVPVSNLEIGAYGTGNSPIISGADVLGGAWVKDSGNVYYTSVSGVVYQVFQNGEWVHLAHEPDAPTDIDYFEDEANKDTMYQVGETGDDMPYTSAQISGASLIGLTAQWYRRVFKIDYYNDAEDTIYLVNDGRVDVGPFNSGLVPDPNRYWLANKKLFLDSPNEWYHDSGSSRLYVYQKGGGTPAGNWEVIKRKYGIYAREKDNLVIKDIEIKNAATGIYLDDCLNFDIDGVDVNNCGTQTYLPGYESEHISSGVLVDGNLGRLGETGIIRNSKFDNILRKSIFGSRFSNLIVENNFISNSAVIGEDVGFGPHGGSNAAISPALSESHSWLIRGNNINHCGYIGIGGSKNSTIDGNVISNSMMYLGDGGAIYAGENKPVIVTNNIINNTGIIGGTYGGTKCGIYIDATNSNNVVSGNIISNTRICLFNHRGTNNHWNNNTCIDYTGYGFYATIRSGDANIRSMEFTNNKLSSSKDFISHVYLNSRVLNTNPHLEWFDSPSDCDYNSYYPNLPDKFEEKVAGVSGVKYNFDTWKSATGLDSHSVIKEISSCVPQWRCSNCGSWSECIAGQRTRSCVCVDDSGCFANYNKVENESCDVPVEDSLVVWYSMDLQDVRDGKVVDKSGNGNDAIIFGEPVVVDGKNKNSLYFDGVDDYLDSGYMDSLDRWTVSVWVKSDFVPNNNLNSGPVMKHENFLVSWNHPSDTFRSAAGINVGGTWYSASYGFLDAGAWHYLTATYDGETLKSYRNGEVVTENNNPSGPSAVSLYSMKIARHAKSPQFFNGNVDEVRVYNYAFSDSEVLDAYRLGSLGTSADDVLNAIDRWKMGQITISELLLVVSNWKNGV